MMYLPRLSAALLIATLVLVASFIAPSRVAAQDPFGGGPIESFPPTGGAIEPFPAAGAADGAKTVEDLLKKEDPVVLAIAESKPTTPAQLTWAVQQLIDLGRPDEAKKYLTTLLAAKPDQSTLASLQRKFGSALFFRLMRLEALRPEGQQLGGDVLEAAYQEARDPARLQGLINDLNDPAPEVRHAAIVDLRDAGADAVTPMVKTLADTSQSALHPAVRVALSQLGDAVVEPLIAHLERSDEPLRAQIIDVLGRLRSRRAMIYLVHPYLSKKSSPAARRAAENAFLRIVGKTPTSYEGEQYLYRRAKSLLAGELAGKMDAEDMIEVWSWDQTKQAAAPQRYPARDAGLKVASRLTADLYDLAPNNAEYRRLYLMTNLETAKLAAGLDQPLPQGPATAHALASAAGPEAVEDALSYAIDTGHVPAAIGATEVLGEIGSPELLLSSDGRPRPLTLALYHGDRRLRFRAAEAILKIDPQQSYPGSSRLTESLAFLVKTVGERRVLIGDPRTTQARSLVGMLIDMGFEATTAATGEEAFRRAVGGSDYEFMLISDAIDSPEANELIQMLRRDPRTATLPIGLIAREQSLEKAHRLADSNPLTVAFPRPHDLATVSYQARRLLSLAERNLVTESERLEQASAALGWLSRLAKESDKYSFYDVLLHEDAIEMALYVPELSSQAADVLAWIGSPQAQRALVNVASQHLRPLAERQSAAKAFDIAARLRGTMLTTDEILQQYDRYNQSASLDQGTQNVMASILDTIERPVTTTGEVQNGTDETP